MENNDHGARMDAIYRHERWIYDPLRKLYLFGRDRLLEGLAARPGEQILEIGCGTARNLIVLHRRCPRARLYGLDASKKMLETARWKLRRRGLEDTIRLAHGLAEDLDPGAAFGLETPFDAVFFSYSLSMIPDGPAALAAALAHLAPGGRLHVVDFWDQAGLPRWSRFLLQALLASYQVRYRPEALQLLQDLSAAGEGSLELAPTWRRWGYHAAFEKPSRRPDASCR